MLALSALTSSTSSLLNVFKVSACALTATFTNPVRYRYFEEKERVLRRRWGNPKLDKVDFRGLMPRVPTGRKLPIPPYVPKNPWSEKAALFGQNDYIDILGDDENISPVKFAYHIPSWLRGFRGHEYHMLLRKRWVFGSSIAAANPKTNKFMKKRLHHLYKKINYKTKSFMDPKVMRR